MCTAFSRGEKDTSFLGLAWTRAWTKWTTWTTVDHCSTKMDGVSTFDLDMLDTDDIRRARATIGARV